MTNKLIVLLVTVVFFVVPLSRVFAGAVEEETIGVELTYAEANQMVLDTLAILLAAPAPGEDDEEASVQRGEGGQVDRSGRRAKPKKTVCWSFYRKKGKDGKWKYTLYSTSSSEAGGCS